MEFAQAVGPQRRASPARRVPRFSLAATMAGFPKANALARVSTLDELARFIVFLAATQNIPAQVFGARSSHSTAAPRHGTWWRTLPACDRAGNPPDWRRMGEPPVSHTKLGSLVRQTPAGGLRHDTRQAPPERRIPARQHPRCRVKSPKLMAGWVVAAPPGAW